MKCLVKVRVNVRTMLEFGQKLQKGELDRSCIKGETYCIKGDPSVGYSIWEARTKEEFEEKFDPWRQYYSSVEVIEVIPPDEAMNLLLLAERGGSSIAGP
jgi:hypothetical protein